MNNKLITYIIMRRRIRRWKLQELKPFDSSSMGDIAFLLLVFFIVTGSFILREGIYFSLPSKSAGSIKIDEKQIIEVIPLNDDFLYNAKIVNRTQLKEILTQQKYKQSDSILIIKMKHNVKYDRLVDTLSLARETGLKRVSLRNINDKG